MSDKCQTKDTFKSNFILDIRLPDDCQMTAIWLPEQWLTKDTLKSKFILNIIVFVIGIKQSAGMCPHNLTKTQLEHHLNHHRNLALLGKILHETYGATKARYHSRFFSLTWASNYLSYASSGSYQVKDFKILIFKVIRSIENWLNLFYKTYQTMTWYM